MGCNSCGGGAATPPSQEFVYTDPQGRQTTVQSETEAKIQVSVNGGGSYKVKKK